MICVAATPKKTGLRLIGQHDIHSVEADQVKPQHIACSALYIASVSWSHADRYALWTC